MLKKIQKIQKILQKHIDKLPLLWYNIYVRRGRKSPRKEDNRMAKKRKKPTTYEIAELILKALTAIAALITAIKWW